MENNGPKIIASGDFDGHEARGNATITQSEEGYTLHLKDYWIAPGAPDVRVYLSPDDNGAVEVEGVVDFGQIQQLTGQISYPIPATVSIQTMKSVVIYCKVYSVLFGYGKLEHRLD